MKKTITYYLNFYTQNKRGAFSKVHRNVLLVVAVMCLSQLAVAQQTATPAKKPAATPAPAVTVAPKPQIKPQPQSKQNVKVSYRPVGEDRPYVVSVTAGTTGLGVEGKRMLDYNLNLKAGFSFLPKLSTVRSATADFNNDSKYAAAFSKAQVLIEYSPLKSQSVRLVAGPAYVFSLKTTIDRQPTGNYKYGDIVYTPDEIGTVHTLADWKGIAGYIGLGFFKIIPRKRFNVTLDVGTYYLSSPETSITATKLLATNASASNNINWHENVSQYRWLPVIQVNYNFRLGKISAK